MLALFLLQVLLVSFHVDDDIKWNYSDRKSTSEKKLHRLLLSSFVCLGKRETSSTILFLQHSDSDKKIGFTAPLALSWEICSKSKWGLGS